jgi:hypothetical protein
MFRPPDVPHVGASKIALLGTSGPTLATRSHVTIESFVFVDFIIERVAFVVEIVLRSIHAEILPRAARHVEGGRKPSAGLAASTLPVSSLSRRRAAAQRGSASCEARCVGGRSPLT